MFQLSYYLQAHNAAIITPPGKTQLLKAGQTIYSVEDDIYHSIFQAADQHFCEQHEFLVRTNILQLVNPRQIQEDLGKQGGSVSAQFQAIHDDMKAKTKCLLETVDAPKLEIATYIDQDEQIAMLEGYSALVFPCASAARKYYFSYSGKTIPENAELSGDEIILMSKKSTANVLIEKIEMILEDASSFSDQEPKLSRAFGGSSSSIALYTKSGKIKSKAALNEFHYWWPQSKADEQYIQAIALGINRKLLGKSLNEAIFEMLPHQKTVGEMIKATVEALKKKENSIKCDNKEFRLGPYGAVTFLLDNKDKFVRDGNYLKKKNKKK